MPRPRTMSEITRLMQYAGQRFDNSEGDSASRFWLSKHTECVGAFIHHKGRSSVGQVERDASDVVDTWMGFARYDAMIEQQSYEEFVQAGQQNILIVPGSMRNPCREIVIE
jgi:hypothetical protein